MTVTIDLPPKVEQEYATEAKARGISVEQLVRDVVLAHRSISIASPADLTTEEWLREFHAWVESHRDLDLPVLSDEDMSRETIYEDRGL